LPLRDAFVKAADSGEAVQMKEYMKNKFEFFGLRSSLRKDNYKQHKTNPALLVEIIDRYSLSGLSRLEALKWMLS